ncbi:MAG: 30S ribosomal protein S8 [Minisyncoccia bacterium]|jgi:small subunit ribosomal protein S8
MYYRLLPELKNALRAGKDKMTVPFSRMDLAVLTVLAENGYIKSAEKEVAGKKNVIAIKLGGKQSSKDMDFKVLSKPSRRFYSDSKSLHRVRQGYGLGVLSTSSGVMSAADAKKKKVGGEYLFQIW